MASEPEFLNDGTRILSIDLVIGFFHILNNTLKETWERIWGFPKIVGFPQIIHFNRVFHIKPSILGYPYFWKHPYFNFRFLQCIIGTLVGPRLVPKDPTFIAGNARSRNITPTPLELPWIGPETIGAPKASNLQTIHFHVTEICSKPIFSLLSCSQH